MNSAYYKNKHLWEKRIPTIPALILLIVSIFVSSYVIQKGVFFIGKASPDTEPQSVKITNVTDTSFTVIFTTGEKANAAVSLSGKNELTSLIFDDRDKSTGQQHPYYVHSITVPNLKPSTLYYFNIFSNSTKYLHNGQPYLIKTAPMLPGSPPEQKPLFGKIILPDGSPGTDVLVSVTIPGGEPVSAVTKENGEYILPTNSLRNTVLSSYLKLQNNTSLTLTALRQDFSSTITVLYNNGEQVPPVTLSQNYDFSKVVAPVIVSTNSASLSVPELTSATGTFRIIIPKKDQSFTDKQPLFQGTGLASSTIKLSIPEAKISSTVSTDRTGFWSFRPTSPLSPGHYTFQIEAPDSLGTVNKLQQTFNVFATGSQLSFSDVPSSTPKLTATPTLSPTPTVTVTSTPLPTITNTISPAASIAVTPLFTSTPTPTLSPTPTQVVFTPTLVPQTKLESPGSMSTVVLTTLSVLFIVSGTILLFML